jgi:hypothetical protein
MTGSQPKINPPGKDPQRPHLASSHPRTKYKLHKTNNISPRQNPGKSKLVGKMPERSKTEINRPGKRPKRTKSTRTRTVKSS